MSLHDRRMKKEAGLLGATVFTPKRPAFRVTFHPLRLREKGLPQVPADRFAAVRRHWFTILR